MEGVGSPVTRHVKLSLEFGKMLVSFNRETIVGISISRQRKPNLKMLKVEFKIKNRSKGLQNLWQKKLQLTALFVLFWFGLVWFGLVWFGVVWCGVVWCGVVWCGVVWFGLVCLFVLLILLAYKKKSPHLQMKKRND